MGDSATGLASAQGGAMRVLVASTAGAGHWAGLLPFARAAVAAGHDVRVAAPASFAATVEGAGLVHEPFADADPAALGAVFGRIPAVTMHEADDLVVREVFGRLDTRAALPAVQALVERWRPDVVLREPAELGVLRRRGAGGDPARADVDRARPARRPDAPPARRAARRGRRRHRGTAHRAAVDHRAPVLRRPRCAHHGAPHRRPRPAGRAPRPGTPCRTGGPAPTPRSST